MNRDKLQEQLDEMKTKVAEMEAELNRPKKFELKYEKDHAYLVSTHEIGGHCSGSHKVFLDHGRYRQTKEAAELSLARNRRANRLEALVEQVGSIKEFYEDTKNYTVYYTECSGWEYDYSTTTLSPEKVYMDETTAKKVCEILNAGEYEL